MRCGVLWLASILALLTACERPAEEPARQHVAAIPDAEVVAIGDSAASTLSRELMGRVRAAIDQGGPAYAIDFCSEQALPLTAAVADSLGVGIKRTTMRVRNPKNAPDEWEQAALEFFESELTAGKPLPAYHIQRFDGQVRYYKPIVVADFCMACHGPRESLDPAVRQALDARYPDDQATGYRPGDFRGVIRVDLSDRGEAQ